MYTGVMIRRYLGPKEDDCGNDFLKVRVITEASGLNCVADLSHAKFYPKKITFISRYYKRVLRI
jgi:hypothetical protein